MTIAMLKTPENWKVLSGSTLNQFINEEFGDGRHILTAAKPKNQAEGVFAILEHQKMGYIAHPNSHINTRFIVEKGQDDLKILNEESGLSESEKVRFKGFSPAPTYHAEKHLLEYGIELLFGREAALNLYRIKLIRDGALILTLVGKPKDNLSLTGWEIQVQAGYRYQDYQKGKDKLAEGNLENLMLMNSFI
ncbi:DUF2167 domain-containing protein [Suttonella ornithocola]|uniref:Uncharacterized membrane-anchored protein conserved in bacteria n=1 Tax=Suttonella ornithocola TaxID=279832 RepID=A0A380MS65_9GAMM|nr:DUF2167 domain-containing protein [Suttonella ornithocola]SUO95128.1 Uncharacterized membrane-anchored protein conserved in bacteria [Suttonella ornithocola]